MELLDIVDESGNPTGQTVEREYAHRNGIRHRTSHVWIYKKKDNKKIVLLQQRSDDKDSYPGCYDISSAGHIPAGFGYKESALRELQEELAVVVSEDRLIECGTSIIVADDCFYNIEYHDRQVSKVYLLQLNENEAESIAFQESEIQAIRWMEYSELVESVKTNSINHCILLSELEMIKNQMK